PQVLGANVTSDVTDNKDDFHQGYRNHFLATPWDAHYRPALEHQKPKALGIQTAFVTGPPGEEIHCDEYGRVKVQFHWDRDGQANDNSSCWLRVATGWAGNAYGGIATPRVGMEVLVTFLEGDPDQPLISGCLFHKENVVPYDLPANKTRSTFKTLSSPGGKGYNEFRIEDKKGAEQIYLHAQRDWDENIEHDQKIHIGNERHDTVEADVFSEFKVEEHRITHLDRKTEARADDHLTVGATRHVKIGAAQFVEAGTEIHYHAGDKVVIEAGVELTAKAGGSFVKLDAGGVTISGPEVKVNTGGSAGVGTGIGILTPLIPGLAAADAAGNLMKEAKANPTWLELNLHYDNLEPVPGASYRVDFADGSTREGVLDEDSFARLENVPQGPAKVYYGEDPRPFNRESVTVVQNSDEKVNQDLRKLGLDPDQIDLQALVEKAAGRVS
ncbi:type VI secretion system tip protein VgrG, partial [Pseudomonas syringae pv. pisi]|uniref:type VI secretion system tip protein TssI/VgrG n=2 Tax=Pseudomonas TaxID=286 RepID=UPI000D8F60BF